MSKYLIGAAAAAVMTLGASGAWAATCDDLGGVAIEGRCHITTQEFGDPRTAGNSGNVFVEVLLVTTSYPINNGGQVAQGEGVSQDEGSESGGEVKVCQNTAGGGSTQTDTGADLGFQCN